MRILVTNDDGVHSPGLWSLAGALRDVGEVMVVAPDRDQSGVGSAMTLLNVVDAQEITPPLDDVTTYSVQGTPGDCVILGTEYLFKEPFDLVVSGINQGANMGMDVLNSGTVGGAFHGYFRNITSMAVSVANISGVNFEPAAQTARVIAQSISNNSLPSPLLLNVNLPNVSSDKIAGVEMTSLGPKAYLENVEKIGDARRSHYWIRHNRPINAHITEGTDIWAVRNNCISITPIDPVFSNGNLTSAVRVVAEEVSNSLAGG